MHNLTQKCSLPPPTLDRDLPGAPALGGNSRESNRGVELSTINVPEVTNLVAASPSPTDDTPLDLRGDLSDVSGSSSPPVTETGTPMPDFESSRLSAPLEFPILLPPHLRTPPPLHGPFGSVQREGPGAFGVGGTQSEIHGTQSEAQSAVGGEEPLADHGVNGSAFLELFVLPPV